MNKKYSNMDEEDKADYLHDALVKVNNQVVEFGFSELEFLEYLHSWILSSIRTSKEYNYSNAQEYINLYKKLNIRDDIEEAE